MQLREDLRINKLVGIDYWHEISSKHRFTGCCGGGKSRKAEVVIEDKIFIKIR